VSVEWVKGYKEKGGEMREVIEWRDKKIHSRKDLKGYRSQGIDGIRRLEHWERQRNLHNNLHNNCSNCVQTFRFLSGFYL